MLLHNLVDRLLEGLTHLFEMAKKSIVPSSLILCHAGNTIQIARKKTVFFVFYGSKHMHVIRSKVTHPHYL